MGKQQNPPEPEYDRFPEGEEGRAEPILPDADPVDVNAAVSLRNWEEPGKGFARLAKKAVAVDCGWGRLLFGHTFADAQELVACLKGEKPGQRDLALYIRDPQVVLAQAPDELFLDPSFTFRIDLRNLAEGALPPPTEGLTVRRVRSRRDARGVNRLFKTRHMVPVDEDFILDRVEAFDLVHLVAENEDGQLLGTVMGVDHVAAFNDPELGASLWTLAVDPQAAMPGIGRALVVALADRFRAAGRAFMDLSVLADNQGAIALYEKLGFQRVPVFCIKHKHNPVNERLFTPSALDATLNPYARIIVDEAHHRGIAVDVIDADEGYFALTYGGRTILCRESLSELTTAVAMSRCADKRVTARILDRAGLIVPAQAKAGTQEDNHAFLREHKRVVVKPVNGEQGQGITVDVRTQAALKEAIAIASAFDSRVLLEQYCAGADLRIIVIDGEVVAAAVRRPASVIGDGKTTLGELIRKQSRRRATATGGESRIPLDTETERCCRDAGLEFDEVVDAGVEVAVRKTANLHTGGTIHDVTDELNPFLARAAVKAAAALGIPVVGLDFLVPDPTAETYVIIEANERPGLANHEPRPTAERFLDYLFPRSSRRGGRRSIIGPLAGDSQTTPPPPPSGA